MSAFLPEVSISSNETHISSTVAGDIGASFAFYVFRNNERIHVQWYTPQRELKFEHNGIPGVYRVTAFIRVNDVETITNSSRESIVFGRKIDTRDINADMLEDRPLLVRSGSHDFHCLFYRRAEKRLFVLLTAAVNRPAQMPIFNRWLWRDRFPGSVLCVSDPTLAQSKTLGIGWYIGSEENDATSDLSKLVEIVAKETGVNASNIVAYGSSAGGFSAMALASRIPGAMAVAINPQTDATKYSPARVAAMIEHCFPGRTLEEVREQYGSRVDMTLAIPQSHSRVVIVQNTEDHEHWDKHFLPFANATGMPIVTGKSTDGRHASIVYSHESGHASETPEIFEQIIELIRKECRE